MGFEINRCLSQHDTPFLLNQRICSDQSETLWPPRLNLILKSPFCSPGGKNLLLLHSMQGKWFWDKSVFKSAEYVTVIFIIIKEHAVIKVKPYGPQHWIYFYHLFVRGWYSKAFCYWGLFVLVTFLIGGGNFLTIIKRPSLRLFASPKKRKEKLEGQRRKQNYTIISF